MTAEALSYVYGASAVPLLGETIGENFDRAVATYPDRDALVVRHQDVKWSYRELGEAVARAVRVGNLLRRRCGGVRPARLSPATQPARRRDDETRLRVDVPLPV